jgi:hypothetical protein
MKKMLAQMAMVGINVPKTLLKLLVILFAVVGVIETCFIIYVYTKYQLYISLLFE